MANKTKAERERAKFYEDLVAEVNADFVTRQEERRNLEIQWELNMNYLMGNQYCEVSPNGELTEEEKYYSWQNRSVYNHIAPIADTRTAKLARVRPSMSVRAASGDESDLKTAKTSTSVLNSACQRMNFDAVLSRGTQWSETCGTAFYKIIWNNNGGRKLVQDDSKKVYEGDVDVIALSPYEIYPDSLLNEEISDLKSLIHARAMHVNDVESLYGVRLEGREVDVFSLSNKVGKSVNGSARLVKSVKRDHVIVIERFEMPTKEFPNGRIVTVAGDELLYIGELPYKNGVEGERCLPFVKQCSISRAGSFFGESLIERLIPIQRAYNAVKNRKHEFMNRITSGVLTVEDGSVDADELIEDGLCPGKVLVYRQGSRVPQMMSSESVPADFTYEEERLYNEFVRISGMSEVSRNSAAASNVSSGVALELLVEQDDTRLTVTAEHIRRAVKETAKQILRLYKQFAAQTRLAKLTGDGNPTELFYFNSSDISSDDVVFDTENELNSTPAQKKSAIFDLLNAGLLQDDDGKMSARTKNKVLELLGYGNLEGGRDLTQLHVSRAQKENLDSGKIEPIIEEYDAHDVHIDEHIRYLISGEYLRYQNGSAAKQRLTAHIREHKQYIALQTEHNILNEINQ